jgi:plasmid stability protein
MATFTVKNIPDDLYERLKASAAANLRSINSEIIVCIEQAVASHTIDPDAFIVRARSLRAYTQGHELTDEELNLVRAEGRP